MMENSRDPRFLIEDDSEEKRAPQEQSTAEEQNLSDEAEAETQSTPQGQNGSEDQTGRCTIRNDPRAGEQSL